MIQNEQKYDALNTKHDRLLGNIGLGMSNKEHG